MILTPEQVQEIAGLADEALSPPWTFDVLTGTLFFGEGLETDLAVDVDRCLPIDNDKSRDAVAMFMAKARTDVPNLCTSHEELRAEANRRESKLGSLVNMVHRRNEEIERLKAELEQARAETDDLLKRLIGIAQHTDGAVVWYSLFTEILKSRVAQQGPQSNEAISAEHVVVCDQHPSRPAVHDGCALLTDSCNCCTECVYLCRQRSTQQDTEPK